MSNHVLDQPMLSLSRTDKATMRDYAQNILVTGVTGGGKTSGPGRAILTSLAKTGAGGVIACAKPSEADEVCVILEKAGRGASIIRWNGRNASFNLFNYALAKLGVDGLSGVVEYIMRIVEIMRNASALRGGDGEAFWLDELKRALRNILLPIYLVTGTIRLRDILAFAHGAPTSLEQMRDPRWQAQSPFYATMAALSELVDDAIGEQLMAYWLEFAQMDGKLRSSILASFNMLDRLNHGWLGEAFTGETSIVPALCFHGAIIVLDMPRATHGEDGPVAQMLTIDALQSDVLARNALNPIHGERAVFIFADEVQEVVTSRWSEFLAMSRSSLCVTVGLTQSLPSFYAKLGGQNAHDRTHHLIANFGTRIFCANGCAETNEWASRTIGKSVQRRSSFNESQGTNSSYGMNMGEGTSWNQPAASNGWFGPRVAPNSPSGSEGGGDNWARNRGHGSNYGTSHGWSEQLDYIIEPGFFARGLKTGGPANGNRVSAIWYQAGRRFAATGGNFLQVEFQQ